MCFKKMILGGTLLGITAAFWMLQPPAEGQAQSQGGSIPSELIKPAEMIFFNAQVLTADNDDPEKMTVAEAIAVRDGKIFKFGKSQEILRLAGPATQKIDVKGRSLVPAAIYSDADNAVPGGDIHKESQWDGAVQEKMRNLVRPGAKLEEIIQRIKDIVGAVEPKEPIFIRADNLGHEEILSWTKKDLDQWAPKNPLGLWFDSSHGVVNSLLLDMALKQGLPKENVTVIKDEKGEPTGQMGAQGIGFIGYHVRPWPSPEWIEGVAIPEALEAMRGYARAGVSVATGHMSGLTMTIMNRLFHQGKMPVRVYPAHDFIRQNPNAEQHLKRMGNLVDFALSDDRGPMVKIIGAAVGPHSGAPDDVFGMMTLEPKINVVPGLSVKGKPLGSAHGFDKWSAQLWTNKRVQDLSPEEREGTDFQNLILARKHGWNLSGIHNMGSGALKLALEAIRAGEAEKDKYVPERFKPSGFDHNVGWPREVIEEVKKIDPNVLRFSIGLRHSMLQRRHRLLGLKHLNSLQYGEDGVAQMAPIRSLVEAGIYVNLEGTEPKDFPERWPMWYIEKAVTRVDSRGRVVAANESVDRKTGLLLMTRWAARYIGEEKNLGSLEPGKWADLVVMNGNFLEVPANKISQLKPQLTLVGGNPAFVDPDFEKEIGVKLASK